MLNFKKYFYENCILLEMSNVTHSLQIHKDQELVNFVKSSVNKRLNSIPWFQQDGKRMLGRYLNFFTYLILQDQEWQQRLNRLVNDPNHQRGSRFEVPSAEFKESEAERASNRVVNMWRQWGDYFMAMGNRIFKKLNSASYLPDVINAEVQAWHEELAARQRSKPRQDVKTLLTLDHLGPKWKGWKWVDLETSHCSQEAEAMGHCGNSSMEDNLLSLRDPEGYAHLTFALNKGFLGESKGRKNQKPSPKYHDAIVELLKTDHVHAISGGGYEPHNNFRLDDLDEKKKKELGHKKYLDDPIEYFIDHGDSVDQINNTFNTDMFEEFDGQDFALGKFENYEEMEIAAKKWSKSDIKNISWLDEITPSDHIIDSKDYVDYISPELRDRIEDYLKKTQPENYEELSFEELIEEDGEIDSAIASAASDAIDDAIEAEAHKDIQNQLGEEDENGFYIDFEDHPWKLKISKENLKRFYKKLETIGELGDGYMEDYIELKYTAPYYGYDGISHFNEKYFNEILENNLHGII